MNEPLLNGRPLESYRVLDLKAELDKRRLPKSGNKKELIQRLKNQLILEDNETSHADQGSSKPPPVNIGEELTGNDFIRDYLAQRESLYKEANTSNDDSATDKEKSPEPNKILSSPIQTSPTKKNIVEKKEVEKMERFDGEVKETQEKVKEKETPVSEEMKPIQDTKMDSNMASPKEIEPEDKVKAKSQEKEKFTEKKAENEDQKAIEDGRVNKTEPARKEVTEEKIKETPVPDKKADKEDRKAIKDDRVNKTEPARKEVPEKIVKQPPVLEKKDQKAIDDSQANKIAPAARDEETEDNQELGISFEVTKEDNVVMQDEQSLIEDDNAKKDTTENTEQKDENTGEKVDEEEVDEIVPIRRLGNPVIQRQKRQWSKSKARSSETETISSSTLKDLVPDIKPLLAQESLEEDTKEDDQETEEEAIKDDNKEEMNEESQSKDTKVSKLPDPNVMPIIDEPIDEEEDANGPCVIHVSNLVRPFTVNQLRELLARTGEFADEDFIINKIKSECFVKYKKPSEAKDTVGALDGVKWPTSNPKTLVVKLSEEEKFLKFRDNLDGTLTKPALPDKKRRSSNDQRGNSPDRKRRRSEKEDRKKKDPEPPKLLEELFHKTKATPNIYWQLTTTK